MKKMIRNTAWLLTLCLFVGCQRSIDLKDLRKVETIYYAGDKPYTGIVNKMGTTIDGKPFVQGRFVMSGGILKGPVKYFDQGHNLIITGAIKPVLDISWLKVDLPGIKRISVESDTGDDEINVTYISDNLAVDSVKFKSLKPTLVKKLVLNGILKEVDTSHIYQFIDDGEFPVRYSQKN